MIPELAEILIQEDADELFVNGVRGAAVLRGQKHYPISVPGPPAGGSRQNRLCPVGVPAEHLQQSFMIRALQEFVLAKGLRLDPFQPEAGGSLHDGLIRWHCLIPPAAPQGPVIALRRHRFHSLSSGDFSDPGGQLEKIRSALRQNQPLLFCGETGSGKSSLMHVLMREHLHALRLILIEEEDELPLDGMWWSRLLVKKKDRNGLGALCTFDLLKASLRLRPDRVVFGELRGADLSSFQLALNSGIPGPLATIHAGSAQDVYRRFSAEASSTKNRDLVLVFCQRGNPPGIRDMCTVSL